MGYSLTFLLLLLAAAAAFVATRKLRAYQDAITAINTDAGVALTELLDTGWRFETLIARYNLDTQSAAVIVALEKKFKTLQARAVQAHGAIQFVDDATGTPLWQVSVDADDRTFRITDLTTTPKPTDVAVMAIHRDARETRLTVNGPVAAEYYNFTRNSSFATANLPVVWKKGDSAHGLALSANATWV